MTAPVRRGCVYLRETQWERLDEVAPLMGAKSRSDAMRRLLEIVFRNFDAMVGEGADETKKEPS